MAKIEINRFEVLALKKLALINGALAQSLNDPAARLWRANDDMRECILLLTR